MWLPGKRVIPMQNRHQRIFTQREELQISRQRAVDSADAKINLPALQVTNQGIVGAIVELNPQPWKRLRQRVRQQRKQQRTDGRHEADAHRSIAARLDNLLHILKCHLRNAQHPLGMGKYRRPQLG